MHSQRQSRDPLPTKCDLLPSQAFTSTKLDIDFLLIIELNSAVTEEKLRECIAFNHSMYNPSNVAKALLYFPLSKDG